MSIDWSFVDKVVYINLKSRKDRRSSIEKELRKVGVPKDKIHRFEAIEHPVGYIGCAMSHAKVLELSIINSWGNTLILEDDFIFNTDLATEQRANQFLTALTHVDWNVALLSANYYRVATLKSFPYIVKALNSWCCCAYLVNQFYAPILYQNFIQSVEKLKQGGERGQFTCDVHWMQLSTQHNWLGMYPVIGHQKPGMSDIEGQHMDYTKTFYKSIESIAVNA